MSRIRIFSKVLAILFAIILITAPIGSALTSGYSLNEETPSDAAGYGDTYEYTKFPANNSFVKGTVAVDADITEVNTAAVNVAIDGVLLSESLPAAWDTTTHPDGSHTAGVYVSDTAGNDADASVSVTVDNTPPAVAITAPANGSAVRGVVNVTADVYDSYLAESAIAVNGTVVSDTSKYIWDTTAYPDGWYNITATAADMAANTGTDDIWVEVDNTPPELLVNELTDNPTLDEPQYRINGTVEAGAILTINGNLISHNGTFEYTTNVTEGTNTITVTATDAAGNTAT
jgi:predicted heme/steroid binding protein